jgi:Fe2+ transport system protein FeoA
MSKKKVNELKPGEKGGINMIRGGRDFHWHLQGIGLTFGRIIEVVSTTLFADFLPQPVPVSNSEKRYVISFSNTDSVRTTTVLTEQEADRIYVDTNQ